MQQPLHGRQEPKQVMTSENESQLDLLVHRQQS